METLSDDKDIQHKRTVEFTNGIALKDFLSGDGAIFEIKYDDFTEQDNQEYENENIFDYRNTDCLGLEDEDTYNDSEPFESLAKKMTDLLPDGHVKKRILREGVGNVLPENGYVTCDYNAYIEYSATPFDSTYARRQSFKFRLDEGRTLPGLEIGIKSMKISEKAQFLIHSVLAYGEMGCFHRVPPKTQVLFEVEVKNCLNTGAVTSFDNLTKEEQESFENAYEFAQAACLEGNDFFKRNLPKPAIKKYNEAVSKLEKCVLGDYSDQEKQQTLLLRLYTNLVVTYTKNNIPRKACTSANEIFRLVKGTPLKIPAKVYFNNARSLIMLGDYESAKYKLAQAKRLLPNEVQISKEFLKLEEMIKENCARELKLAKAIFKDGRKEQENNECVTQEFKETLKEYFNELNNDPNNTAYNLPSLLNRGEIEYIKVNAPQFSLKFGESNGNCYIYKES